MTDLSVPSAADDTVRLDIPAATRHVATARVVAASMAAAAGWTVDDIDDVRLALDELLAVLVEAASGASRVQLALSIDDGGLRADGVLDGGDGSAEIDDLSARIVAAVADDYELGPRSFRLLKAPAER